MTCTIGGTSQDGTVNVQETMQIKGYFTEQTFNSTKYQIRFDWAATNVNENCTLNSTLVGSKIPDSSASALSLEKYNLAKDEKYIRSLYFK